MGKATFIGLSNYRTMLQDETFWTSIKKNTFILLLYIPLGVILPVLISAVLREGLKGWSLFRAIIYIPNILGYVIMGMISSILFRKLGPLNNILMMVGLDSLALDWLSTPKLALNTLGLVYGVWLRLGFGCIFFLAAMSSIDESLYDAAKIDGALWWRTFFWNVTIPPSDSLLNSGQYYHLSKFWHEHFPLFTPSPVEALDLLHSRWNTVSIMKDS